MQQRKNHPEINPSLPECDVATSTITSVHYRFNYAERKPRTDSKGKLAYLLWLQLYVPALASALKDAANDAISLHEEGSQSKTLLILATLIAFLAVFELSGESTSENAKEVGKIIYTRRIPSDWPKLSSRKKFIVISSGLMMATWCAASEMIQAYSFVKETALDYPISSAKTVYYTWKGAAIAIAIGSGITKLLTDNWETAKTMWRVFSGYREPYANRVSQLLTPAIGGTFGAIKALHDAVTAYDYIKLILNINSPAFSIALAFPCLLIEVPSNFCFAGLAVTSQMDELFGHLQKRKFEPAKIVAFGTSLGLAVFLSDIKRTINISYYKDIVTQDFNLPQDTLPNSTYEFLGWIIFIAEVMLVTASLNPQLMHLFILLFDKIGKVFNFLTKPCQRTVISEGDVELAINKSDEDEALPLLASNSLFAQHKQPGIYSSSQIRNDMPGNT